MVGRVVMRIRPHVSVIRPGMILGCGRCHMAGRCSGANPVCDGASEHVSYVALTV